MSSTSIRLPVQGSGGSGSDSILRGKYVRTTRFASISATTGTLTIPPSSEIVLDDFGGTTDAVITQISGGKPVKFHALTSANEIISTSLNSSGDWVLSGTPGAYPVAIVYRVRQLAENFDSTSSDILGIADYEGTETNIQVFSSSGTWIKPSGAKVVKIYAIGAGGGGGAGRRGAAGTVRCGGGGGAAGAMIIGEFDALALTSSVSVTIGAGGTGAVATTSDNTDGANGVAGGSTTFGGYMTAPGGGSGKGGTATNGLGGTATIGAVTPWAYLQSVGANAITTGGVGVSPATVAFLSPNAGSAGGGISSGDAIANGANGGAITSTIFPGANAAGGTAGGVAPANAGAGNGGTLFFGFTQGSGGGSSRSSITSATGNGGDGGNYGGGGGGSGATLNGFATGAGGRGADGAVLVITYF